MQAFAMQGFQWVRIVKLVEQPFSVENGLITPTFKLKRSALQKQFAEDVDLLYDELAYREKQVEIAQGLEPKSSLCSLQ